MVSREDEYFCFASYQLTIGIRVRVCFFLKSMNLKIPLKVYHNNQYYNATFRWNKKVLRNKLFHSMVEYEKGRWTLFFL